MIFLNLVLLGGLLAAGTPIVVHILHQRRLRQIDWGAMRFLRDMMTRRRKRLRIEHWLLLSLRIAALVFLALALMRPQIPQTLERGISEDFVRRGSVAAVLLIDDSATSGLLSDSSSRLDAIKKMAYAYLDGLERGDEVSLITLSSLGQELPPPLYDISAVRRMIEALQPSDIAADHPSLLQAGLDQLTRHVNPQREIVLISDGAETAWRQDDRSGWSELQRRLSDLRQVQKRPVELLLLQPELAGSEDVAITSLSLQRNLLPLGTEAALRIHLAHFGQRDPGPMRLRVDRVGTDGTRSRNLHEIEISLSAGEQREWSLPLHFDHPGAHPIQVELIGARDDNPRNDRQVMVVEAFEQLPVLVVEGRSGRGLQGSGAYVSLALQPDPEIEDAVSRAFAVTRISSDELAQHSLDGYRCIVLADVEFLESWALSRVERAVRNGAGLLSAFAPSSDIESINRFFAREGAGIIPVPLARRSEQSNGTVSASIALPGHPALIGLRDAGDRGLHGAEIRQWLQVDEQGIRDLAIPLRWTNGDPALLIRRRGLGNSALLTTSADIRHSRLPLIEGWAPLVRNLVSELASPIRPPRNLHPGDRLTLLDEGTMSVRGPTDKELLLHTGVWEERRVQVTDPLRKAGLYRVHGSDGSTDFFAVASEPEAWNASIAEDTVIQRLLAGMDYQHLRDPSAVEALAAIDRESGRELWPWLIVLSLTMLLIEGFLAARYSIAGQRRGA